MKVGRMKSELFDVCRGVRQGCTLSPWLFNVFMDRVTREAIRQFQSEVRLSTGTTLCRRYGGNVRIGGGTSA